MKPRILFLMLEFPCWKDASHWSFSANIGMESGFEAHGIDYRILPTTHRYGGHKPFWVDYAQSILGEERYDQVWFEVVHSSIDDLTLEFISEIAPVRLGFAFESLELLPIEWEKNPTACQIREESLEKRLAIATHLATIDEFDAQRMKNRSFQVRSMPPGFVIPRRFICEEFGPPSCPYGLFYGTLYGERGMWLEQPELRPLLRYADRSPEFFTELPTAFDKLHSLIERLFEGDIPTTGHLNAYLDGLRTTRTECFKLWLEGLRLGAAVVNLPQLGRLYPSRIIEGMAAGRPVITGEIEGRPQAQAAFEDGTEILFYRSATELAHHLERIIKDRDYANRIARAAREKVRRNHCTEDYIAELLNWTI
jgi:hypothetical protein